MPDGPLSVAALLQADFWTPPQPRVYAVGENAKASDDPALWMLCWTNLFQSPGNAGSWSAWVPLGGTHAGLGNGPTGTPTDTLFAMDPGNNGSLDALRQNPLSRVWTDGLVKRPSWSGDDIETVATYQTEAALFDGNGMPLASVPVTVLAESPVEAWINNVLYPLDPVRGVTVPTNARGVVLVKTLSTSAGWDPSGTSPTGHRVATPPPASACR